MKHEGAMRHRRCNEARRGDFWARGGAMERVPKVCIYAQATEVVQGTLKHERDH